MRNTFRVHHSSALPAFGNICFLQESTISSQIDDRYHKIVSSSFPAIITRGFAIMDVQKNPFKKGEAKGNTKAKEIKIASLASYVEYPKSFDFPRNTFLKKFSFINKPHPSRYVVGDTKKQAFDNHEKIM